MRNADPQVRDVHPQDAEDCATVAFRAHTAVSAAHNFPSELPSLAVAARFIQSKVDDPNTQGFLIERKGQIVGSIFLTIIPECPVAAIGPLTVDPAAEGGIGRKLLQAALRAAHQISLTEVRLIQSPMHLRSFALYTKVGFDVCEPLLTFESAVPANAANGDRVRFATPDDVLRCQQICHKAYGFARTFELIAHSPKLSSVGFFVPVRNGELLRWLFQNGVRALWPATVMSSGGYQPPTSAFLPAMAF